MHHPWYVTLFFGIVQVVRLGFYVLVVWLVVAAIRQWMGVKRTGGFLPQPALRPSCLARATDALLLASITGGIVAASVVWYSQLDFRFWGDMPDDVVWWNNAVAITAFASVLACGWLSYFWRTGPSLVLSVICLLGYAHFADGRNLKQWILDRTPMPTEADCPFTIEHAEQITGADVWINGAYFGQTPIKTTLGNLLAVPEWQKNKLPGEYRPIPGWSPMVVAWSGRQRELFCQMTLNGERMGLEGGAGSSGSSLDERNRQWHPGAISITHAFPNFNAELKRLIQWVQLHDHKADETWLVAFESYGEPGGKALGEALKNDPGCREVWNQLLVRKYQAERATTPDEAWKIIERIAAEADEQLDYSTGSLAGRTVELLAPKLDPRRLANFAKDWMNANPTRFVGSYSYAPLPDNSFALTPSPRYGRRDLWRAPHSAYVWAHAVWKLDRELDRLDDSRNNPLEEILTPFLLIDRGGDGFERRLAMWLGGSVIDRWLRWQMAQTPRHRRTENIGNENVDELEWMLARSTTATGKQWRATHPEQVRHFAELSAKELSRGYQRWSDKMDFLFAEFDGTAQSFAARFWPRFRELTKPRLDSGQSSYSLIARWEYLTRIEPLSTIDMYFDCWTEQGAKESTPSEIAEVLRRMPKVKATQLLQKIVEHLEAEMAETPANRNQWPFHHRQEFWIRIQEEVTVSVAERFARIVERTYPYHEGYLAEFMKRSFDLQMFEQLLTSPSDKARLVLVTFLRDQPTPIHRGWLAKLASDANADVQSAATQAIKDLQQQAAESPPLRKFSPPAAKLGDITFPEPPLDPPQR